jgi:Zn-finger nucleic acid-binding protein
MICPTCNNVMIVVEHEHIELDYCTECSGTWFDSGELELLTEVMDLDENTLSLSDVFSTPEVKTSEKERKCPVCNQKMKKTMIGKDPEIMIDRCSKRDGLWFDGGEIHKLISQWVEKQEAGTGSQKHIITFLGETIRIDTKSE